MRGDARMSSLPDQMDGEHPSVALESGGNATAAVVDEEGEVDGHVQVDAQHVGAQRRAQAHRRLQIGLASLHIHILFSCTKIPPKTSTPTKGVRSNEHRLNIKSKSQITKMSSLELEVHELLLLRSTDILETTIVYRPARTCTHPHGRLLEMLLRLSLHQCLA